METTEFVGPRVLMGHGTHQLTHSAFVLAAAKLLDHIARIFKIADQLIDVLHGMTGSLRDALAP